MKIPKSIVWWVWIGVAALTLFTASASAFVIETELTGETGGFPSGDLHKVTISGDAADGGGADSFTVTWTVPEGTVGDTAAPFDLVTAATFTVQSLSDTVMNLRIDLDNTQVLADAIAEGVVSAGDDVGGLHSLLAFGFNAAPEVTGVTLLNDGLGGATWEADLATGNGEGLPGFKPLNVCMWAANSCNGGNVNEGLIAGDTDTLTLSLVGNFSDGPMIMLLDFPAKTQGLWGSFETGGVPDCCDNPPGGGGIPEPGSMALILLGMIGLGARRRRMR